jgi:hypothetical protein
MAGLFRLLLCGVAALSFGAAAAPDDDGFVWLDANTKIRLKPIGSNAASGATTPEKTPKTEKKTEKPKK